MTARVRLEAIGHAVVGGAYSEHTNGVEVRKIARALVLLGQCAVHYDAETFCDETELALQVASALLGTLIDAEEHAREDAEDAEAEVSQ